MAKITQKFYIQFENCEIDMTDRIRISQAQYNQAKAKYNDLVEETKDDDNVGQAYKSSEIVSRDMGNYMIYMEWFSVGTATVYLYHYKCKDGYEFVKAGD